MKGLALCVLILPVTLRAQWAVFEPCGLASSDEPPYEVISGPAPNYGPYSVWIPAVVAVLAFRGSVQPEGGVVCSLVVLNNGSRRLVIGTSEQVLKKLNRRF